MLIINCTQHSPTAEQQAAGVFNSVAQLVVKELLTFNELPSQETLMNRANDLTEIIEASILAAHFGEVDYDDADIAEMKEAGVYAMIGGAPYLMAHLESALRKAGITPLYAYSERVSVEVEKNNVVTKTNVFQHKGFVGL